MRSWRPILEPSPRGKHDRFYDLLSRLLFSPRRTPSSRAPCSLVARVQLLAPLYSVYTSRRLRFFGSRRATRPGSSGIERRVESSARSRVQQAHTFPYTRRRRSENGSDLRTDALSLRSASSTSGPTSKRTELFSTDRERGRERERDRCSLEAAFRLLFAAHDPSSPLPSTERRKEGKLHERNLPRYRKPFRCRADASNLCRVNDRLVKIEKSLAGCLSRASSRFLADPSSCPFTAIFRFRP